jgi:hypothetical protein
VRWFFLFVNSKKRYTLILFEINNRILKKLVKFLRFILWRLILFWLVVVFLGKLGWVHNTYYLCATFHDETFNALKRHVWYTLICSQCWKKGCVVQFYFFKVLVLLSPATFFLNFTYYLKYRNLSLVKETYIFYKSTNFQNGITYLYPKVISPSFTFSSLFHINEKFQKNKFLSILDGIKYQFAK